MALSLDVEVGQSVQVGEAKITLVHKTGRKARISIDADRSVSVSLNQRENQPGSGIDRTEKE